MSVWPKLNFGPVVVGPDGQARLVGEQRDPALVDLPFRGNELGYVAPCEPRAFVIVQIEIARRGQLAQEDIPAEVFSSAIPNALLLEISPRPTDVVLTVRNITSAPATFAANMYGFALGAEPPRTRRCAVAFRHELVGPGERATLSTPVSVAFRVERIVFPAEYLGKVELAGVSAGGTRILFYPDELAAMAPAFVTERRELAPGEVLAVDVVNVSSEPVDVRAAVMGDAEWVDVPRRGPR